MKRKFIILSIILSMVLISSIFVSAVKPERLDVWGVIAEIQLEIQEIWNSIFTLQNQTNSLQEQINNISIPTNVCPSDMIEVNNFCIDINQNLEDNWRNQSRLCSSEDKRLCSVSEWHSACVKNLSELQDMTDGFEIVGEFFSSGIGIIGGISTCDDWGGADYDANIRSRCCKDL